MQNGNTNVENINENINETKVCNFLYVDGPKIGTYCCAEAPWWDGNRIRCDAHLEAYWPKETYQCVRILKRGPRKGEACGSNTKFADAVCSRCRKTKKGIARAVPIEHVTPIVTEPDQIRELETAARRARSITYFNATRRGGMGVGGVQAVVSIDGFPIYYPVEDGTDRHPCECPTTNMPRQSAILV